MNSHGYCYGCRGKIPEGENYTYCNECIGVKVKPDIIEKPAHYHKGGIDVIEFCEGKLTKERQAGFFQMNVLKYVTRYTEKNGIEDLKKAEFYIQKLIELEESK